MGNTLRNCVSSPEESEGSHQNLLRENSDSSGTGSSRHQHHQGRSRRSSPSQPQARSQRYYVSPSTTRRVDELSEDEQVKIAKRLGLIGYLPIRFFTGTEQEDEKECVICMADYEHGEQLRYLPCTHRFHKSCIDAWLMRSFTCPNCSQSVDAGLVGSFDPLAGGAADRQPPQHAEQQGGGSGEAPGAEAEADAEAEAEAAADAEEEAPPPPPADAAEAGAEAAAAAASEEATTASLAD